MAFYKLKSDEYNKVSKPKEHKDTTKIKKMSMAEKVALFKKRTTPQTQITQEDTWD